jgi:hypothetical protein
VATCSFRNRRVTLRVIAAPNAIRSESCFCPQSGLRSITWGAQHPQMNDANDIYPKGNTRTYGYPLVSMMLGHSHSFVPIVAFNCNQVVFFLCVIGYTLLLLYLEQGDTVNKNIYGPHVEVG